MSNVTNYYSVTDNIFQLIVDLWHILLANDDDDVNFSLALCTIGLTENDGHENDGPSKLQDMKLQDMKLEDKQRKSSNRDYIIMEFLLLFSKHATMVHSE